MSTLSGSDNHSESNAATLLAYGALAAGAAVILAPHVLPALGVGEEAFSDTFFAIHTDSVDYGKTFSEAGNGLAGVINRAMANIPFVGETLAAGGWMNAITSASIGIGGVLLGNHVAESSSKNWGRLITIASVTTSALIALPTLLSGLTMGVVFLGYQFTEHGGDIAGKMLDTLGQSGSSLDNHYLGFSGLAAAIPHALTCGVAIVPAAFGISSVTKRKHDAQGANADVSVSISLDAPTRAGQEAHAKLTLTHADTGAPLTAEELAVVHTEKLHLFVVDQALKDYHHIHPRPTGKPGEFAFSFTPKTGSRYSAWADFVETNGAAHQLKTSLPSQAKWSVPATPRPNNVSQSKGATFAWRSAGNLVAGKPVEVTIEARDFLGNPLTGFEPIMGAYAHLVGFGADGNSFIHCHPTTHDGRLNFHIEAENAGPAQFFLQIQRNGKEEFIPFGQVVLPSLENLASIHDRSHPHCSIRSELGGHAV